MKDQWGTNTVMNKQLRHDAGSPAAPEFSSLTCHHALLTLPHTTAVCVSLLIGELAKRV